ncbi:carbon catabolite repressor protein 4 homolog 6-like isoform X1 [Triticum urartu]|uniref:Endonuclease/exonuclease/phosphatase domain-containing protein n=1 Tax=Triticum urartu TaxID=4572 RepID=A0A8R7TUQ2_TRIUA|nr:carbon catabolite repressor protein 4 homolog 6-like isoform X1 [Triticum urartu]XP_048564752.1 carbon catabolite repressor protein 4 homolog 6-like isoform X1 [Triticum urartu]
MRVVPSAFLRRAASMSSHYNRQGSSRPHRGYSSRPPPPSAYADAELVSGDSYLSTEPAANDSVRRGGGPRAPPPQYRHGPQFQPPPPYVYGYGQPQPQPQPQLQVQPYGFVPYNYNHPPQTPFPGSQYGYGTPNQYGHWHPQPYRVVPPNGGFLPQNAGFRPAAPQLHPSLAQYKREWRSVQKLPPRHAERFKVLSYNILADYLAQEHQDLYRDIPSFIMDWNWRKNRIGLEISWWRPDIICFQEVDKFTDLEQEMSARGYSGIWKMRTGNAVDGCAIFWRTARFRLCYKEDIEFNKLGLRDNVAQLCVLESVFRRNVQTGSTHLSTSPIHPQQAKQVVICNIHVLYNPKRGDIKVGQIRTLLDQAYATSKRWNDAPVILCGDFNATPKSPLYNFILEQKLNLFGLARNAISGQQTSSHGLYTGSNTSRYTFRPPLYTTNGREGRIITRNVHKHQSEAKSLVRDSCLAGREPVLTATASTSCFNSESSKYFGNNISSSGPSNLDEQGLSSCFAGLAKDACNSDGEAHAKATEREEGAAVDSSSEECSGGIKAESKEPDVGGVQCSQTDVCDEAFQSDSSEAIDSRHLLSSELSGRIDSVRELRGVSSKDSNSQGDLSGSVICEDVTGGFEGNSVQSDMSLNISKENPGEKEKCNESMSGHNNCTTPGSESSHFSDSLKSADARGKMGNMRVEEEINTGSPVKLTHQINSTTSDSCGNECTPEVINNHLDLYSCPEEFGNHACSVEDDVAANENLCSNVISDPTSFKEFSGDNECLHVDNDQLPKISNGSQHAHKVVPYGGYYNDPYRWTVDEIKAATGKEECTYVEHNLKVRSVYTDVEDFNGTKDANKEPLVTSYNRKFMGTVDYIWASEDLQTVSVLDTFPEVILKEANGFPTKKWGSDHIALVCELAFKE